jgi:hypothetical protein
MFSWRCFPFVESAPRAYRLKASNAAPLSSTSAGTFPFTKQLEIDPENPDVYRSRSLAYADRRDNVSALADDNKAIELTRHRIEASNSQPN